MHRYIRLAVLVLAALSATACPTLSEEATMRLRGSDLTFSGEVISFDGETYRLETQLFGKVNLDLRRFECISGACLSAATTPTAVVGPNFGIQGSSSVGNKLMPLLIAGYAESIGGSVNAPTKQLPEEFKVELLGSQGAKVASIDLITHGSSSAFSALAEGKVPIGMSSRPINNAEAELLPSVREHVLAYDALLVIVSPQNPISTISPESLASVFTGAITDWSELGQAPGKINVYARNEGSGALDTFRAVVLNSGVRPIARSAKRLSSDSEISDAVAQDPRGIGFTSFAYAGKAKSLSISAKCGITYSPSVFNAKAEEYPLSRHFFLYTSLKSNNGHASGLLDYALSTEAQRIISYGGFINRSFESLAFKNQGDRIVGSFDISSDNFNLGLMRQLIQEIGQLNRLSVTFRFRSGSFSLDHQSRKKVENLAAFLSGDQLRGKEILLLGFSDALGAFDQNRELSVVRAREVKQEIMRFSNGLVEESRIVVKGYGELLPVGCNDSPLGRARNRRVEVWLDASLAPANQKNMSTAPSQQEEPAASPAPQQSVVTAPAPQAAEPALAPAPQAAPANNQNSFELTDDRKKQLFQEFLDWRGSAPN